MKRLDVLNSIRYLVLSVFTFYTLLCNADIILSSNQIHTGLENFAKINFTNKHHISLDLTKRISKNTIVEILTKYTNHYSHLNTNNLNEEDLIRSLCKYKRNYKWFSYCTQDEINSLMPLIQLVLKKQNPPKYLKTHQLLANLTSRIKFQNSLLRQINKLRNFKSKSTNKRIVFNLTKKQEQIYQKYLNFCINQYNSAEGTILLSPYYTEKFGGCKKLEINDDSGVYKNYNDQYVFTLHRYPNISELKSAKRSLLNSYKRTLSDLRRMYLLSLTDMAQNDALSVIKTSLIYAEFSIISQIKTNSDLKTIQFSLQDLNNDEKNLKLMTKVGNILMVASIFTGIGSVAVSIATIMAKSLLRMAIKQGAKRSIQKVGFKGFDKYLNNAIFSNSLMSASTKLATVSAVTSIAQNPFLLILRERESQALEILQNTIYHEAVSNHLTQPTYFVLQKQQNNLQSQLSQTEWKLIFNSVFLPVEGLVLLQALKTSTVASSSLINGLSNTPQLSPSELIGIELYLNSLTPEAKFVFLRSLSGKSPQETSSFLSGVIRSSPSDKSINAASELLKTIYHNTRYINPVTGIIKLSTWGKNGITNFISQVKDKGLMRFIVAPRAPTEKFDYFNSILSPLVDLPVELINLMKVKLLKAPPITQQASLIPSLPASILFWAVGVPHIAKTISFEEVSENFINGVQEKRVGANYIAQWVTLGSIDIFEASHKLIEFEKAIRTRDMNYFTTRINQLIQIGVLTRAQVPELIDIMIETLNLFSQQEIIKDSDIKQAFDKVLSKSELAQYLPKDFSLYGQFLFYPTVLIDEISDIEWYSFLYLPERFDLLSEEQKKGVKTLKQLLGSDEIPTTTIISFVAKTLSQTEVIDERIKKAKTLGIQAKIGDALYRMPYPLSNVPFEFLTLTKTLQVQDEIDLWNIIFTHPSFSHIAKSYQAGEISDIVALMETKLNIIYDNKYLKIYNESKGTADKEPSLTVNEACALYNVGDETHPDLKKYLDQFNLQTYHTFTSQDIEALMYLLTQNLFAHAIKAHLTNTAEQKEELFTYTKLTEQKLVYIFSEGNFYDFVKKISQMNSFSCP
ncbi:MAG: hypothetical protein HON90_11825 [Halobacteriovoraceae bacterium]|jgi:hypothetical protein|nr:hypothetical protein [Halobacteriovoraceae bacterium]